MSAQRPRPWVGPTPLHSFKPVWAGQFDTFQDWVSHAPRALTGEVTRSGSPLSAVCIDARGRRCADGGDFMRARDEGTFPVRYFFTGTTGRSARTTDGHGLTPREAEIMAMVAERWSNKDIARHLNLSPRTVESHRLNARRKLAMQSHQAGEAA